MELLALPLNGVSVVVPLSTPPPGVQVVVPLSTPPPGVQVTVPLDPPQGVLVVNHRRRRHRVYLLLHCRRGPAVSMAPPMFGVPVGSPQLLPLGLRGFRFSV